MQDPRLGEQRGSCIIVAFGGGLNKVPYDRRVVHRGAARQGQLQFHFGSYAFEARARRLGVRLLGPAGTRATLHLRSLVRLAAGAHIRLVTGSPGWLTGAAALAGTSALHPGIGALRILAASVGRICHCAAPQWPRCTSCAIVTLAHRWDAKQRCAVVRIIPREPGCR